MEEIKCKFEIKNDSTYVKTIDGNKYYTNNSLLKRTIKLFEKYTIIRNIFISIAVIAIVFGLFSLIGWSEDIENCNHLVTAICNGIGFGLFVISFTLGMIYDSFVNNLFYERHFIESEEFKQQQEYYIAIAKEQIRIKDEEERKKKATQLTNVYHTLDSRLSKENKINKIMEYLKDETND